MNDLSKNTEEKPSAEKPPLKVKPKRLKPKQASVKRTALTATLMFLIPFCLAVLFAVIAKRFSPASAQRRKGMATEQAAASDLPVCSSDASVAELMEHRHALRSRGETLDLVNLRIWAAAGREPTLLFEIPAPGNGDWSWSLSQCGGYALAVERTTPRTLIKDVALYNFKNENWVWRKHLPWPENYEDPWIFGGRLILRSSKNNRRFAMELDQNGGIISLDALGEGGSYIKKRPEIPDGVGGEPLASRSNVIFVSDSKSGALRAYSNGALPGLYSIGALPPNSRVTGNGLLKFTASTNGTITATDAFTGRVLKTRQVWSPSTNATVEGIESIDAGASVTVNLKSAFNFDTPIERRWSVTWNPSEDLLQTNLTSTSSFRHRRKQTEVVASNSGLALALLNNNMLELSANKSDCESVVIDLSRYVAREDDPARSITLLKEQRFLLINQSEQAYLLDLFAVKTYAALLSKVEHSNRILANHSDEELSRTNIADNVTRELKGADRKPESADNFNYEMKQYENNFIKPQHLEPPAKPSILSLQAEFLANHHAWLYAANKLEQLRSIQERDSRAPTANPLLQIRYALLNEDEKRARHGCENGLQSLFYDRSPYNRMIRWQILMTLLQE